MALFCLTRSLPGEWRANQYYVESRCVLLDKRVAESRGGAKGGITYRSELLVRHTVGGQDYEAWTYDVNSRAGMSTAFRRPKEWTIAGFAVGDEYPCWYDPADPSQVVLVRGYSCWTYTTLVVLLLVAGLTVGGVARRQWLARHAVDPAGGADPVPDRIAPAT
jgi:hypothetical protein